MGGHLPVERDEFVGLGAAEPPPGGQLLKPAPLRRSCCAMKASRSTVPAESRSLDLRCASGTRPAALISGEGVRLALRQAGVGSRTIAAAVDVA